MPYIEISQDDFENVLNSKKYRWIKVIDPLAKENIYLIESDGISIKVYSSIVDGVSRKVGEDAIRVIGFDPISNLCIMVSEARVYRTDNWRSNLVQRIESVKEKMNKVDRCKICGSIMVERENRTTHDKFMGCLNYRNHPKKIGGLNIKSDKNESRNDKNESRNDKNESRNDKNESRNDKNESRNDKNDQKNMQHDQKNEPKNYDQHIGGNLHSDYQSTMGDKLRSSDDTTINTGSIENARIKLPNFLSKIKFHEVAGSEPLLETKLFQWAKYPFDKFNVIQSKVAQFVEGDNNTVIEAKTSTGKTIMGELFMWKVLKDGKKVIYTSPLKALTREKYDSWTKKFGEYEYKVAMVTGDFKLTDKRIKELNDAHIILCTSEMLDHRTRNMASEKSEWLMKAGLLIVDEVQMIGMKDRGDKLEAGLMRFTTINPGCRLILLSGTMPNSADISAWISDLNKKETILIKSGWRPIILNMKYEIYDDTQGYYAAKESLFSKVIDEVKRHKSDKILIFVHSKTDGRRIIGMLEEMRYKVDFHNADLDSDERVNIEESFKSKGDDSVRIIIATSTLAYGLNLPARIVIICGMHRGIEEVSELDIIQMAGRSGRMGIDVEGDAIIILPANHFEMLKEKIENPGDIISQMNNPLVIGFHIIGEIVSKWIRTRGDVYKWYSRTLATRQNILEVDSDYVNQMIDFLLKNNAIREVNGQLVETELGKACTYFYLRPDMLNDLTVNWTKIFDMKLEDNEFMMTRALSRLGMYNDMIVSKAEKGYIESYHKASQAMDTMFGESSEGQAKVGMAYLNMIKGIKSVEIKDGKKVPNPLAGVQRALQQDIERVMQALVYIDVKYAKWDKSSYWSSMAIRLKYGVGPELVGLCMLEGVNGVYASKLYNAGIRQPIELITKKREAMMVLGVMYHVIIDKNKKMFEIMGFNINKV